MMGGDRAGTDADRGRSKRTASNELRAMVKTLELAHDGEKGLFVMAEELPTLLAALASREAAKPLGDAGLVDHLGRIAEWLDDHKHSRSLQQAAVAVRDGIATIETARKRERILVNKAVALEADKAALVDSVSRNQWLLEAINHTQSTSFKQVSARIIANRATLAKHGDMK